MTDRHDEREALARALQGIVEDGVDMRDAVDAILAAGFRERPAPTPDRLARRVAWDEMNLILDREGDSPAYREAYARWAGMYADGTPKVVGEL